MFNFSQAWKRRMILYESIGLYGPNNRPSKAGLIEQK